MGLFSKLKSIFSNPNQSQTNQSPINTTNNKNKIVKHSPFIKHVTVSHYKKVQQFTLDIETNESWDSFFTLNKINPKLIGFEKRSRKKFRHLFHDQNIMIAEAAGSVELVKKEEVTTISFKNTPFEKLRCIEASQNGLLLTDKENVGFFNLETRKGMLYRFEWQPFSFALGRDFWLVGTRKTYEGPGELYCFDMNGEMKWGLGFKELIASAFGEMTFIPYHLGVSADSTDILVSSMDRLYRLDVNGQLRARIAISELKEKDLQEKHGKIRTVNSTHSPRTEEEAIQLIAQEFASQFIMGFERMFSSSPFAGFAHDPNSDMLFILESEGRVSAWDHKGSLDWIIPFKNESRFIDWVDDKLVVSFLTGETFWLDKNGNFLYGTQLPKQAATVSLIPNQHKYLIVSEDNRLYELDKETGKLISGSEGHPGMELFNVSGNNIFFDGTTATQGYFWLAPINHHWQHFEAKTFTEEADFDIQNGVAPEITATKKFAKQWELKSKKGHWGSRVVDIENKRVYVVEKGPRKTIDQRMNMTDSERRKDYMSHNLVCYDFNGNKVWSQHFYSSMWHLYLSPDGENIITSIPIKEEITYLPGHLVVLNKDGKLIKKFKVKAHGFYLDFINNTKAFVEFRTENSDDPFRKGTLTKIEGGQWDLVFDETLMDKTIQKPFGAGLDEVKLPNFNLKRIDKKKYIVTHREKETELKLSAAIYEAYETANQHLVIRVGNRTITFYDLQLAKKVEIKEQENISSVMLGEDSFVILTKSEARGYSSKGDLIWRFTNIPKTTESSIHWIPEKKIYIWSLSNNLESMIVALTEKGEVKSSQSFDKKDYHRSITVFPKENCFVAEKNELIQVYKF